MNTLASESEQVDSGRRCELLLAPKSHGSQRVWRLGSPPPTAAASQPERSLRTCPHEHKSFASLRAILGQLCEEFPVSCRYTDQLDRINWYIDDVYPASDDPEATGRLMVEAVAFAVLRRISRESVYTSRVIDLSARTINAILAETPGCSEVHVYDVDRIDRPTLKVLARAMLLLDRQDRFTWVWHMSYDAHGDFPTDGEDGLYLRSRFRLLRYLQQVLAPQVLNAAVGGSVRPTTTEDVGLFDISAALVLQNYDACFNWCDRALATCSGEESVDILRLKSLAAINVGEMAMSLSLLAEAELRTSRPGHRAHLSYLQGLIEAKRRYALERSDEHYQRGLLAIEEGAGRFADDLDLEHAWLLNGLALNDAVRWKQQRSERRLFRRAFEQVRKAFNLVRDGDTPARVYLRANLLANTAFLLEIQGSYELALTAIEQGFDYSQASQRMRERFRTTLGYRIGVLHFRAGRPGEAVRLLEDALDSDAGVEKWPTQERILRALGAVAWSQGSLAEASEWHRRGYDLCRSARAAEGTLEHAKGLVRLLMSTGKQSKAFDLCEQIAEEEGLYLTRGNAARLSADLEGIAPSRLSPKLPAYVPAIDLEDIPEMDINRFLGGSLLDTSATPFETKGPHV